MDCRHVGVDLRSEKAFFLFCRIEEWKFSQDKVRLSGRDLYWLLQELNTVTFLKLYIENFMLDQFRAFGATHSSLLSRTTE